MYDYVPPKQAPAKQPKPRADIELPGCGRHWRGVVWHHSLTNDTAREDWKAIRKYHTSYRVDNRIMSREDFYERKKSKRGKVFTMPWSDIGYHAGVERINGNLKWRLGRSWDNSGAHAGIPGNARFNRYYLGVCAVGNFDRVAPDKEFWEFALAVTRTIMDRFGMSRADVLGHRETYELAGVPKQKECPGRRWDMNKFRLDL